MFPQRPIEVYEEGIDSVRVISHGIFAHPDPKSGNLHWVLKYFR